MTNPNDSAIGFAWSQEQGTSGLTKREYFAAMAMQGFVAATRYDSDSDSSSSRCPNRRLNKPNHDIPNN